MNILIVLHGSIDSNSGYHVKSLAGELNRLSNDVVVATPHGRTDGEIFRVVEYGRIIREIRAGTLFENGHDPDVLHLWTPRQLVLQLCEKIKELCVPAVLIHLEDNEESVTRSFIGDEAYNQALKDPSASVPVNLTHPRDLPRGAR